MPILLTKPFSVGALDPNQGDGYPMAQLISFTQNALTFAVEYSYEYGTATGEYYERWEKGAGSPTLTVYVAGPDVAALWSKMPNAGESVGQAIRRVTYEHLISTGAAEGTVVDSPPLPPPAVPAPSEDAGDAPSAADPSPADGTKA